MGFVDSDGSKAQQGACQVLVNDSIGSHVADHIPGLKNMSAATIPIEIFDKVRIVHHFIQYETKLVAAHTLKDGSADELKEGWKVNNDVK